MVNAHRQCDDAAIVRQSCRNVAACFGGWTPEEARFPHLDCNGKCMEATVDAGYGDPQNCGTCGHACGPNQECQRGQCNGCQRGELACNGYDRYTAVSFIYCTDPQSNNANCGKCGHACPEGLSCVGGHCER